MSKDHSSEDIHEKRPKRGRPSGRNRAPLSLEERRARNALYERERRNETAEAMAQLAEALGQERSISNAELLATAVTHIQRTTALNEHHSLEHLQRINSNLESQIETLTRRLGLDTANLELPDEDTGQDVDQKREYFEEQDNQYYSHEITTKQKNKRKQSSQTKQQRKRTATQMSPDTDSGIESQSPTHSEHQENIPSEQTTVQYPFEEYVQAESQAQIDLQSELYRQLYQSDEGPVSFDREGNPLPYCIESIAQTLITIPEIRPPQVEVEFKVERMTESPREISVEDNSEHVDMQTSYLPDVDVTSTLSVLTEREKVLLSNLINENFFQGSVSDN